MTVPGVAVMDMLRAAGLRPVCVTITGGDSVSHGSGDVRVPKRDLVSAVQVLLQSGRLKFANALPEVSTLSRELLSFRVTIDPKTAHDSYSAWRERDHDDQMLASVLPCWYTASASVGWTVNDLAVLARSVV